LIRADMVLPGATVIDVGTTFVGEKLTGDVAYDQVAAIAREITPVPGGVGPVTNVALMRNVVLAAERLHPG
jgi:methylenetetrahydrofolate dehydrogenase (NADP+)/methenyltetrahydrofolate cyclohydrolase